MKTTVGTEGQFVSADSRDSQDDVPVPFHRCRGRNPHDVTSPNRVHIVIVVGTVDQNDIAFGNGRLHLPSTDSRECVVSGVADNPDPVPVGKYKHGEGNQQNRHQAPAGKTPTGKGKTTSARTSQVTSCHLAVTVFEREWIPPPWPNRSHLIPWGINRKGHLQTGLHSVLGFATMQTNESSTATLLISCPNRTGLVAAVSQFLFEHGADITHADHHIDFEADIFFMRVEWKLSGFTLTPEETEEKFAGLAGKYQMEWQIHFSNRVKRVALFVSKQDHCLLDLLWRYKAGEYPQTEFPLLISNHLDNGPVAKEYGMNFRHFPITSETKESQEKKEIALLRDYEIDLVVLARYMQILTRRFVEAFPRRIINIHHSFLPAFVGGNPYRKAYERGVKLVGATSHYVTEDLDEGPIIDQDVVRVSHRDTLDDLIRKGRDLEKQVLARAVRAHLQHNVLCYANKTVVFR